MVGNSLEYRREKYHRAVGEYTERNTDIQNSKAQTCMVVLLYCTSAPNYQLGGKFYPNNMQLGTAIMNQP